MRGSPAGPRRAELSAIDSKKEEKVRLHELVWVASCVTASAAWASGPGALASRGHGAVDVVGPVAPPGHASRRGWGSRSVHRLAKMASRVRFGAFVYTVAPLWTDVGTQECTQIGENSLSGPFWGICVHCCAVSCAVSCTVSCDASCDASCGGWREWLNRPGVPAAPPRWSPLPWSEKRALREWRRR